MVSEKLAQELIQMYVLELNLKVNLEFDAKSFCFAFTCLRPPLYHVFWHILYE